MVIGGLNKFKSVGCCGGPSIVDREALALCSYLEFPSARVVPRIESCVQSRGLEAWHDNCCTASACETQCQCYQLVVLPAACCTTASGYRIGKCEGTPPSRGDRRESQRISSHTLVAKRQLPTPVHPLSLQRTRFLFSPRIFLSEACQLDRLGLRLRRAG